MKVIAKERGTDQELENPIWMAVSVSVERGKIDAKKICLLDHCLRINGESGKRFDAVGEKKRGDGQSQV